jgi:hypothetical protein
VSHRAGGPVDGTWARSTATLTTGAATLPWTVPGANLPCPPSTFTVPNSLTWTPCWFGQRLQYRINCPAGTGSALERFRVDDHAVIIADGAEGVAQPTATTPRTVGGRDGRSGSRSGQCNERVADTRGGFRMGIREPRTSAWLDLRPPLPPGRVPRLAMSEPGGTVCAIRVSIMEDVDGCFGLGLFRGLSA